MKKVVIWIVSLLLISCGGKEPIDQAVEEISRINGQPSETRMLGKGVQWRKYMLPPAQAGALVKETKMTLDKALQVTGISIGNGYRWETAEFKIEFELHTGRQTEPTKLLLWTTKKRADSK